MKYKYVVLYGDKGVSKEFDTPARAELWARMKKSKGFRGEISIDKVEDVSGGQSHYKMIQKVRKKLMTRTGLPKSYAVGSAEWVKRETGL